jgi:nucleoside-diphosphate-sugar epimerase
MTTARKHIVLGGNGVVGRETVAALRRRGEDPTSVGRRASAVDGVSSAIADLLIAPDVARVLEGARVAYLTAGLDYSSAVWAEQWPVVVRNAIDAAVAHGTHLVYFDNVYAYGRVAGPMTEQTAVRPTSRKGRVRADALAALEAATTENGLSVTIARSADFYGPGATTSVFNGFALARIAAGRSGTWLFDADQPHSLSYTPDIGEALATLGTSPAGRGGVWHVPTAPALTGREYVRLAAGSDSRVAVMGRTTMRVGALFNRAARETLEMGYQYTAPYVFDSTAFETAFGVSPTPVAEGIAATLESEGAARVAERS